MEIFCNISVFTVTFDQFNASLLNKNINYFRPQTFEWYSKYKRNITSIYLDEYQVDDLILLYFHSCLFFSSSFSCLIIVVVHRQHY